MATKQHGQIVETPTEARQAEPGPSVFALLTIAGRNAGLLILILAGLAISALAGAATALVMADMVRECEETLERLDGLKA